MLTVTVSSDSQCDILSRWLQDESKSESLMVWPKPTAFVANCLGCDEAIDHSLIEWESLAGRLLNLLCRHRGQLTLLGMAPGNELLLTQLHLLQDVCEDASLARQSSVSDAECKEQQRLKGLLTWLRARAHHHAGVAYDDPENKVLQEQMGLLEQSELFDVEWYLNQYNDIAKANIRLAEHSIKFGAIEERNPTPHFNTGGYVLKYPDINFAGSHPLLHYFRDDIKEQLKTQEPPK
ncbi:hypothetical protein E0L35_14100 [Halomonas sp. ATBC28]|uniref:hypothetical protein n=1 Tax=Halomonas sp. ATBC28 TaxID=2545264 RepID=UPI00110F06B4|nr:hypothetical protein [Halomonas sp. ATBC28]TMU23219.1 hypothetical protein E0L35_14100 [Halomonas sp. ATBC28]